jgi:hypothetical protein
MPDTQLEKAILDMAKQRGPDKSVCPSEIARQLFGKGWRRHMGEVRDASIQLKHQQLVDITQKGVAVDVDHIKGPIRIKIKI